MAQAVPATAACSIRQVANPPGVVVLPWQVEHSALPTGICSAGVAMVTITAAGKVLPAAWQDEHALLVTLLWSMVQVAKELAV